MEAWKPAKRDKNKTGKAGPDNRAFEIGSS